MDLITLFAREEPTNDPVSKMLGMSKQKDTVIFKDRDCTKVYARWPWHIGRRPTPNGRDVVTLNCFRWKLEWVPSMAQAVPNAG